MTTIDGSLQQVDFSAGAIPAVAPDLISTSGCYAIRNGTLDEDGAIHRRGGTAWKSNAAFGSKLTYLWHSDFEVGERTVFANNADFGVLGADDATPVNLGSDGLPAPKTSAQIKGLLFIGGGYIYAGSRKSANYATGTVSVTNGSKTVTGSGTTWSTLVDEGMLFQRGSERVYPIASIDSTTQVTLLDAYEGTTGTGAAYKFEPLHKITGSDPYPISDFYAVSQNRLLWGSGTKLRFSGVLTPHLRNSYDEHELPYGAQVRCAAEVGPNTLIFTNRGIWVLGGLAYEIVDAYGAPQHRLERLSEQVLIQGDGLAYWNQALIAPCEDGVYLLDGISSPQKLSENIEPRYQRLVSDGYRAGGSAVFRGHYLLPIISSSSGFIDLLVVRLSRLAQDRRRRTTFPWSWFDGTGATNSAYANDETVLLAANCGTAGKLANCTGYFSPQAANKNDADGTTHQLEVITRDFLTGNGTDNSVKFVRWNYDLIDAASDNPTLSFDYSDGTYTTGYTLWDEFNWDEANWAEDAGASFHPLGFDAGEADGTKPARIRVGKRLRHIRFRVRTQGPAAACSIRGLEVSIRPSRAPRR